jgi:type IV pilus assembly protein PilQ
MSFKKIIMLVFLILVCNAVSAFNENKKISLDLQNAPIQEAIHILAKWCDMDVVISSQIEGVVTLHLKNSSAIEAFDHVLSSHDLIKWKTNHSWFVGTQEEFLQRKQEDLKLQNTLAESSILVTRVWQIHYAKAEDLARILQDNTNTLLSARGHVRVDARTNMLCVQDVENHMLEIDRLLRRLDVPVQQVLIKARLASVDSDFERELGVDFNVLSPTGNAGVSSDSPAFSSAKQYALTVAQLADGSMLDVQLSALENEGHGELISSPSLFTANQQTASIESGEEIPYQEVSKSGATSVAFKKAVLSLKVTPQVMPDHQVMLELQVNQDKPSNRMVLGVPAISTRQMSTHILIKNGQTIVLGGIYESDKEAGQRRIPFLGKIPLVGLLFRHQNSVLRKRELLIFVTPKIIG